MNPNTNPSGLDPTARSFTGQYSQLQNQGSVYPMGSSLTGLQHLQGGVQSQLGARTNFAGMSVSASQPGDRFQTGFNQLSQFQQAQSRHPALALGSYGSGTSVRNQFGGTAQLGLQSQGLGNRPLMNTGVPGFGNVAQNPQGLQGMPLWSTGGQQSMPQSNLHSLTAMNRMQGLSPQQQQLAQVRSMNTLGQNISRDVNSAALSGLLQQQQQAQNPSQDLLSIVRYGNRGQQQQNPYGLMPQLPQIQVRRPGRLHGAKVTVAQASAPGGFVGGRSALPLERPDAVDFSSLAGMTGTSTIGTRPNALTLTSPLEAEVEKATKEEYPALPAAENPGLRASVHGPIGRSQPLPTSAPLAVETSVGVPSSNAHTHFHGSHNMSATVQDSLRNIQAGRVARSPPPGGRLPTTPQKAAASLLLQPPQQLNASCDRFSLLGLNSVIRKVDEDLSMLALGQDLTQLGLKLDDPGNKLHKTFVSPFADHQAPDDTPDFEIPACYKTSAEKLRPEHLAKFKDETLFFMFYSSPGDEAQALASATLISRGLAWHKDHKQWFMRVPNMNPQKSADGERGSYIFFDTAQWKYVQKDNFFVKYEAVETGTGLPRTAMK